ncbi:MAG: hypothetical protein ATN35_02330 [Epulopiscium sp. Nele67-Bin004]|nr:MAG: hypothetical protein ATN35_02330 [Epulopiscium sp. Nele67-Bin004]
MHTKTIYPARILLGLIVLANLALTMQVYLYNKELQTTLFLLQKNLDAQIVCPSTDMFSSWQGFFEELTAETEETIPAEDTEQIEDIEFVADTIDTTTENTTDSIISTAGNKGIYIPNYKLSSIDEYIDLANSSEINSFVLDVKDDKGTLTLNNSLLPDIIEQLNDNDIYPIARLVAFKDNTVGNTYPERMIQDYDGNVYETSGGETWLNPYNTDNWEYLLDICKDVVDLGFKEIQFDYIRFHESMNSERVDLPTDDKSKIEIINEFVDYITTELSELDVVVSASVFGSVIVSSVDAAILGQDYASLLTKFDVIYPMIYPSHYGSGWYGVEYPDLEPYAIVFGALNDSNKIAYELDVPTATVIPWLQDFTASWLDPYQTYDATQIQAQVTATYDASIDGWLLWNGAANYTTDFLIQ